jgi:hypothetical protein
VPKAAPKKIVASGKKTRGRQGGTKVSFINYLSIQDLLLTTLSKLLLNNWLLIEQYLLVLVHQVVVSESEDGNNGSKFWK